MSRTIASTHADLIKSIDTDFEMSKRIMSNYGLEFDSNPPNYWLITKGEESFAMSFTNGLHSLKIQRNTLIVQDEIDIDVFAKNIYDKYWSGDLYYQINEAFGVGSFINDSDMHETEKKRFFMIAKDLLTLINEPNPEELLSHINRHTMTTYTTADLLRSTLESFIVKTSDKDAQKEGLSLIEKYRKLDKYDKSKISLMLDGIEGIIK